MSIVTYENVDTPVFEIDYLRYLFASGESGLLLSYHPGHLYADVDKTVAAAFGGGVASFDDLSGNAVTGPQSVSTARPIMGRVPVGGRRNLLRTTNGVSWSGLQGETLITTGVPDPEGGNQAIRIEGNIPNGSLVRANCLYYQNLEYNVDYTFTAKIKLVSGGTVRALVIGAYTIISGQLVLGEWVDVVLTRSAASGTSSGLYFDLGSADTVIEVYQPQVSEGSEPTPYQRVGNEYDITEVGVPSVYYAHYDSADDVLPKDVTLPAITDGTVILIGQQGIWIDEGYSFAGGNWSFGPTTYPNGPVGIIGVVGDMLDLVVLDRPLTADERDRVVAHGFKRGSAGILVLPPSGLGFTPPFNVFITPSGTATTDINIESYKVASEVTYYLSPTGDDSNDGLSPGSPKKSIATLVDELNVSPPSGATLYLAPGMYLNGDSMNGRGFAFPCNLICESGKAILAMTTPVTWTLQGTAPPQTWLSSALPAGSSACYDMSNLDDHGRPIRLERYSSQTFRDHPNSVYSGSSAILVRLWDDREPDSDVVVLSQSSANWNQTVAVSTFCQGVEWWGGAPCVIINHAGNTNHAFDKCGFMYSSGDTNGFESLASGSEMLSIFKDCVAMYNSADGFGYRAGIAVEIDCSGVSNGYAVNLSSDNGSTTHKSVRSVRVNCVYTDNWTRNIHDINGTKNWLVGCSAGSARNGSADVYANANFVFARPGETDSTLAWLERCVSLGGSAGDLGAYGNAVVTIKDCTGMTVQTIGDSGQIVEETP